MKVHGKYFAGHEISAYGLENGRVDYATLAKACSLVIANDLMNQTERAGLGWWEQVAGQIDNTEEIQTTQSKIDALTDQITETSTEEQDAEVMAEISMLQARLEKLEYEDGTAPECFQYYITDGQGAALLGEAGECIWYNETLDLYVWGVDHWGTAWDYVLTDIAIEKEA